MRSLLIAAMAVSSWLAACGGSDTSPTGKTAQLTISIAPNPARVGTRPTLTIRETAGVGVTATKVVVRRYDAGGTLTTEETFTDQGAWFTCNNSGDTASAHLPPKGECTLLQSTRQTPSQLEFDQYVTDDNGHDLKFTSPRAITTP